MTEQAPSKSTKSASASPHRRSEPKRTRTLKRGAGFREVQDEDFKWFWAAYRKGGWDERLFPEGLDQAEFIARMGDVLITVHDAQTLVAPVQAHGQPYGIVPVGLVIESVVFDGFMARLEPHVDWFPWASLRNRVEAAVKYLNVRRKDMPMMIWAQMQDKPFFTHLARYGVLRRMGTFRHSTGDRAVFQGAEPMKDSD